MSGYTDHSHDEPLFREEQRTQEYSPYPNLSNDTTTPTAAAGGHMFGAPPMGDPAEPSSHPDNMTAAASTPNAATAATTPTGFGSNRTMSLGRSPSDKPAGPGVGVGGGGLRRQPSGAYDAATGTSKTDKGLFSGSQQSTPTVNQFNQSPSQPGVAGTVPVGHQPGSPYVQTQDVPATGKSKFSSALRVIVLFVFGLELEILGIVIFVCVVLGFEASTLRVKLMIGFCFLGVDLMK